MSQDDVYSGTPPMSKRPSRFLGQKLVKTKFQLKFGITIFVFLFIAMLLIWLEGKFAMKHMVETGMVANQDAILQMELLNKMIFNTSVMALFLTFALVLFFSHFIAGPIYRFEKTLEQMRDGHLDVTVHLRKWDELKEVGDLFNQTLASLRNRVKKDRDTLSAALDKAKSVSEELRKKGSIAQAEQLDRVVDEIRNAPPQLHI